MFLIAILLLTAFSCQNKQEVTEAYKNEVKQRITGFSKLYFEAWKNEVLDYKTLSFLDKDFINMFGIGLNQTAQECRKD